MNEVIRKGKYWVEVDAKGKELKRSKVRFEPSKKAAPKKRVVKKEE